MRITTLLLICLFGAPAFAGAENRTDPCRSKSQVKKYLNQRVIDLKIKSQLQLAPDAPSHWGTKGPWAEVHLHRNQFKSSLKQQIEANPRDAGKHKEAQTLMAKGSQRKWFATLGWTGGIIFAPKFLIEVALGKLIHGSLKDMRSQGKILEAQGLARALEKGNIKAHPVLLKDAAKILKADLVELNISRKSAARTHKRKATFVALLQKEINGVESNKLLPEKLKAYAQKKLQVELKEALKKEVESKKKLKGEKMSVKSSWADLLVIKQHQ